MLFAYASSDAKVRVTPGDDSLVDLSEFAKGQVGAIETQPSSGGEWNHFSPVQRTVVHPRRSRSASLSIRWMAAADRETFAHCSLHVGIKTSLIRSR